MNKKLYLEAPQAELIVVRFEGNFCATGDNQNGLEDGTVVDPFEGEGW